MARAGAKTDGCVQRAFAVRTGGSSIADGITPAATASEGMRVQY
jgi:hypothetical protein